jgi:predicted nucleic acid-binding protein
MRLYLDACCVNRLTDNQSQSRIREESEAIERILSDVRRGTSIWVGSEALTEEIERSPLPGRRWENLALLALVSELIETDADVLERARNLQSVGYGAFDALHLSSAESGRADVLLTTDDKFVKRAARGDGYPQVSVRNPVSWLKEVSE